MKYLKILVIILMAMQIGIIAVGIYQLIDGKISKGLFNVLWNASFFLLNIYTLKIIKNNE